MINKCVALVTKLALARALNGKQSMRESGKSLGEFPFASTKEGGTNSRIKAVPVKEQSVQGGTMSQFYKKYNINDGDKFKVKVTD